MPCLGKGSINFIQLSKLGEVPAWKALAGKHRSTDRNRIQTLLTQLTTLKMNSGEPISNYLIWAEILKLDLEEAGEKTSDTMLSSMVLKGLPAPYESIVSVLNIGVQKQFNDMKQDLINFTNSR